MYGSVRFCTVLFCRCVTVTLQEHIGLLRLTQLFAPLALPVARLNALQLAYLVQPPRILVPVVQAQVFVHEPDRDERLQKLFLRPAGVLADLGDLLRGKARKVAVRRVVERPQPQQAQMPDGLRRADAQLPFEPHELSALRQCLV